MFRIRFLFLLSFIYLNLSNCGFDLKQLENIDKFTGILIIGSGPAGLTAAISSGNFGIPTLLVTGDTIGGQISQTSIIENLPGVRKGDSKDVVTTIVEQAKDFGTIFREGVVIDINLDIWPYETTVQLADKTEKIRSLAIIIATGSNPNKPEAVRNSSFWGQGISHCARCDGHFFEGEDVIIVGGGAVAMEEADQLLSSKVKSIKILVRGNKLRDSAYRLKDKILKSDKVEVVFNTEVLEILGDNTGVKGAKTINNLTRQTNEINATGIFLATGRTPNTLLFVNKLNLDNAGYIFTKEGCRVESHAGVYAAGEVGDPQCSQAVEAASAGSIASASANKFIKEDLRLTNELFDEFKAKGKLIEDIEVMNLSDTI